MSRTKSFDENAVLDQAAELFWEKGFEGTSVADLEERLGLGRQSLYNAFGDKREIFLKSLDRYAARNREGPLAQLAAPGASLPELRTYFDEMAEFLAGPCGRRSCLVTNSMLEFDPEDGAVMQRCQSNQDRVRRTMETALVRAQERGEISADLDTAVVGQMLMAQVYGATVLAKAGASADELKAGAHQLLDGLR